MKIRIIAFLICYPVILVSQSKERKDEFRTIDNISLNSKVYTVKAKYSQRDFNFKICKLDTTCIGPTQDFSLKIIPENLVDGVVAFVSQKVDTTLRDSLVRDTEKQQISQLLEKVKNLIEEDKTEAQRLFESIDKGSNSSSGMLLLNRKVPFKKVTDGRQGQLNKISIDDSSENLIIKEAFVHFFNNKATTIFIQAVYRSGNKTENLSFLNNSHSVPIRSFNFYGDDKRKDEKKSKTYELAAQTKTGESIIIALNDVFDYVNNKSFNYSVANTEVTLKTSTKDSASVNIPQRRFFDFFTGVIYSDVLGANSENSNSLLNAQASLLIPMNQKNTRKWTATRQFLTTANIALNNSFDDNSRFIAFSNNENVNHFDLLRKNNLNARVALDVITYESKGWFLNTSLGYSGAFYRTGFRNTLVQDQGEDVITEGQVFSSAHGPYLNFEFRPQTNFGADITLSMENFAFNDSQMINERDFGREILVNGETEEFILKHNILSVAANFYWLTNPEKGNGGIFARLAATYHTPTNSIFPQFFVGYATNLTSFVNRFKPKENEESSED